jgi:protein-disulfide isomerase
MKKTLISLSLVAALTACSNDNQSQSQPSDSASTVPVQTQTSAVSAQSPATQSTSTKSDIQGVSYIIGYDLGQNFNQSQIDINPEQLMAGIQAGASGSQPKLSKTEMQQTMQQFQQAMQAKAMAAQKEQEKETTTQVIQDSSKLINDPNTPYIGPKDAKVAVIEFFDYQCAFCSLVAPALEQSMTHNPNVKFVFKDYPIFGQRWPESYYAANVGLIAFQQGGSALYKKYHDGIFATGHDEGKLTKDDIDQVAKQTGVDLSKANKDALGDTPSTLPETILKSSQLGQTLGFQGTPAIIVMPTQNPTAENTTIFFGYPANPQAGPKAAAAAIDAAIIKANGDQQAAAATPPTTGS